MTAFSLVTFGFPEVHADDRPIKLALRKGLALLVYLAEAKGPVARDVIATLLWPETSRETGLARLRRLLHRVELTLGQAVFETDRTSLRWSPEVELKIDSHQFERACDRGDFEKACRIYRGDFLAGFSPDDCPEFDDWAFFRREALRGGSCRRSSVWCRTGMPRAIISPRHCMRAVWSSSIRSARCMAGI